MRSVMMPASRSPAMTSNDDTPCSDIVRAASRTVAVVVTDNVLPKDEFKVEKVDKRRKLEECGGGDPAQEKLRRPAGGVNGPALGPREKRQKNEAMKPHAGP